MKRWVERGLLGRNLSKVRNVRIDEKSFLRGQRDVSCLTDLVPVRVIDMVESRKQDAAAVAIDLSPVEKVACIFRKHLDGSLAYFRYWITNATAEGLNNKIQAIKAAARGFRNFDHCRSRILLFCGRLIMGQKTQQRLNQTLF